MESMEKQIFIVPGWTNSGPGHWQSIWQLKNPSWIRIEQDNWITPTVSAWVSNIEKYVSSSLTPAILIGHSLGCVAIIKWAELTKLKIAGAFLVAPADVELSTTPKEIECFCPMPKKKLIFPSYLIASDNDPYLSLARATQFASWWGSKLTVVENAGHINTESGHGEWIEGQGLLNKFMCELSKDGFV